MANPRLRRRRNSGQVLVITSLVVVLLLISTVVYVKEIQKNTPTLSSDADLNLPTLRQAALHTVISALVNASNGGDSGVLADDLSRFETAAESRSYYAALNVVCSPADWDSYVDGVWISWGTGGEGISSAIVDFTVNSTSLSSRYTDSYTVNVTSSTTIDGYYSQLNETHRQVNLTCSVLNEGTPAQAENFVVYYEQDAPSGWVLVASPTTVDFGNGTYSMSFTAENASQSSLPVSVHCQDARGVSVWANATCTAG